MQRSRVMKKVLSLFIAVTMVISLFATVVYSEKGDESAVYTSEHRHYEQKPLNITFYNPAADSIDGWKTRSIPMANGYMGISMFGGTEYERLQITEQSMYTAPSGYEGSKTSGQESFGDLFIDVGHPYEDVSDYKRYLSLNDATAHTEYSYKGVDYKREYFSSYPDKVSVVKFSASKDGMISLKVRPEIAYERDEIKFKGIKSPSGKHGTVVAEGDTITLKGNSEYYNIDFEGQFKVITKGKHTSLTHSNGTNEKGEPDNGTITVTDADEVLIIYTVGTNYIMQTSAFMETETTKRLEGNPHPHEKPKEKYAKTHTNQLIKNKHKERILKAAREKQQVTYKGNPICLTADLSAETLQARREWQDIFKVVKGKNLQP